MNYEMIDVKQQEKEKLYKLLQYALYDGSQYIDNDVNEECIFEYRWFDNYFTDEDRSAYFIKSGKTYVGMVMVNENLKFNKNGKCIAEFLIMPRFRRNHIGKRVAYETFEKFRGDWEVLWSALSFQAQAASSRFSSTTHLSSPPSKRERRLPIDSARICLNMSLSI